jgi:hypothetical protein
VRGGAIGPTPLFRLGPIGEEIPDEPVLPLYGIRFQARVVGSPRSGSHERVLAAEQIVRQTAAFAPLRAELEKQTRRRKLSRNMRFGGSKNWGPA